MRIGQTCSTCHQRSEPRWDVLDQQWHDTACPWCGAAYPVPPPGGGRRIEGLLAETGPATISPEGVTIPVNIHGIQWKHGGWLLTVDPAWIRGADGLPHLTEVSITAASQEIGRGIGKGIRAGLQRGQLLQRRTPMQKKIDRQLRGGRRRGGPPPSWWRIRRILISPPAQTEPLTLEQWQGYFDRACRRDMSD